MGKIRLRKALKKGIRPNPVGIPSLKELATAENEGLSLEGDNGVSTYVQTILDQVRSHLAEERDSGLNSMSMAIRDSKILEEILSLDIISIVAPLLFDQSLLVRHSAAGALRNLSGVSGTVCDVMVSQGVMKHLVSFFKQNYGVDWVPKTGKRGGDGTLMVDTITQTYIQGINLLWNLCEWNENALKTFNKESLFLGIAKTLNPKVAGISVALAAGQCLNTVTEENKDVVPNEPEFERLLLEVLGQTVPEEDQIQWIYLHILLIGILMNVKSEEFLGLTSTVTDLVLRRLSQVLGFDGMGEIKGFSSEVPIGPEEMETNQVHPGRKKRREPFDPEKTDELEMKAESIQTLLDAQILSLEILSNLLFGEEEETSELQEESEEEMVFEEMDTATENTNDEKIVSTILPEVCECIKSEDLIGKVLAKCVSLPHNVGEILKNNGEYGKRIERKSHQLRSTALFCLQNILLTFDLPFIGGSHTLSHIYNLIKPTTLSISPQDGVLSPRERELLDAATSALRAVVQKGLDDNSTSFLDGFSTADLNSLCLLSESVGDDRIETNVIRVVGGVGMLVSRGKIQCGDGRILLGRIGEFLLGFLGHGPERGYLWRVAEVLDTIFDVFAEDDFNDILLHLQMIPKLTAFQPLFRKHIRNQRRELGGKRVIVETSRTNLSRFIDYKTKHGCS